MKIQNTLPLFTGFYHTIFSPDTENEIYSYNQEHGTELDYDDFEWDNEAYEKDLAENAVEAIEQQVANLGIEIKFEGVWSPKYYNFANDRINVEYTLSENTIDLILEFIQEHKEEFKDYLFQNYTNYDGFVSFFSNDAQVWIEDYLHNLEENTHVLTGFLNFYLQIEEYTIDELYNDCVVYIYGTVKDEEE